MDYSEKCFTQIYSALYGDAMLVPIQMFISLQVNPAQLFLSDANENLISFLGSAHFKRLIYFLCNICYMLLIVKQAPIIVLQTIFHSVVTPSKSKETIPGEVFKDFKAINILLLLM